jgi:hypothetical protein
MQKTKYATNNVLLRPIRFRSNGAQKIERAELMVGTNGSILGVCSATEICEYHSFPAEL